MPQMLEQINYKHRLSLTLNADSLNARCRGRLVPDCFDFNLVIIIMQGASQIGARLFSHYHRTFSRRRSRPQKNFLRSLRSLRLIFRAPRATQSACGGLEVRSFLAQRVTIIFAHRTLQKIQCLHRLTPPPQGKAACPNACMPKCLHAQNKLHICNIIICENIFICDKRY